MNDLLMSNLIQLQNGSKSYGSKQLFDEASFAINEGEHVGVIGPNGAGKTTLFKILTENETLDDGQLIRSRALRLGYLAQHDQWDPLDTISEYLEKGCRMPIWELKALGQGLGLTEELFARPITSLSGGYRMRCKLLYLIGQEPNLMLLDEPTNYLDLETLLVLEKFLREYAGAFLLISHDREFLRRTTTHILEVEGGQMTKFNGNIDAYFDQKEMLRAQLAAKALSLQQKRDEILDFVARFGAKATKASQAQSRLKSLDKMETIEIKPLPITARIQIPAPIRTGKMILNLKDVELGYGSKIILRNINLMLANGDHLVVVGLNGAGKTTLLKALAGTLEPLRGSIESGYQVSIGYYAQHVAENLNPSHDVLEAMSELAHPEMTRQDALNLAGSLLFSGNDVKKKISVLSGGEKARVALGRIILQKSPCLILDEPTNHLDFQTVEALTQALMGYPGTVVIVSHDRSFIRRIGTKILEIRRGHVDVYGGTYEEYVWSLEKNLAAGNYFEPEAYDESATTARGSVESTPQTNSDRREQKKLADRQLRMIERDLDTLDRKLHAHQKQIHQLNDEILRASDVEKLKLIQKIGVIQTELSRFEEDWLALSEKKELLSRE